MKYKNFIIDDEVSYDNKNRMYIWIGIYKVLQINKETVRIYNKKNELITHCNSWRKATKTAKLLLDSYYEGYYDGIAKYY